MSISTIRAGLATNLATISGLRVSAEIPDNPSPPMAVIQLTGINYDGAMSKGLTTYNFIVSTIVGRVAEREAQRRLDGYASSTGSQSVKAAIESDKTLSGSAFDVRCSDLTNISAVLLGEATYMMADFVVIVYAN